MRQESEKHLPPGTGHAKSGTPDTSTRRGNKQGTRRQGPSTESAVVRVAKAGQGRSSTSGALGKSLVPSVDTGLKWSHERERFFGPILSGAVVSGVLLAIDAVRGHAGDMGGHGMEFISTALKEVRPDLLLYGFGLAALCGFFTSWKPVNFLRRWLLLPFLEFCHHLALVGAGAMVILSVEIVRQGEPHALLIQVVGGFATLLLAGAEMQMGCHYARMDAQRLETMIPVWLQIAFGAIGLGVVALLLRS
jgi:hypothetical protein